MERVVEVAAELLGGPAERGAEVGAADVADEEGVAGEDGVGLVGALVEVEDEDGDGLDGVAGGFEDLEAEAGEVEGVAVFHGDELVLGFGVGAEADVGAAAVAEFEMAGEEVGVEVGEEDVADVHAEFVGVVDVLLDVALGVDHDGGAAGFVGDEIGGVGEAAEVVLLEEHIANFRTDGEASLLLLDEHGDDAGGHEVGHGSGEHGAEAELGEVVAAVGDEGSDAADLHADAADVGEAAEGEGGDGEGAGGEGGFEQAELSEGDELVDHGAGAEEVADGAGLVPGDADEPGDGGSDDAEDGVEGVREGDVAVRPERSWRCRA